MARTGWNSPLTAAVCATTLLAVGGVGAQQGRRQPGAPPGQASGRRRRRRWPWRSGALFTLADADKDGAVTRAGVQGRLRSVQGHAGQAVPRLESGVWRVDRQSSWPPALNLVFPSAGRQRRRRPAEPDAKARRPSAMMAALPDKAPAKPARARKVLVLGRRRASSTRRSRSPRRPSRRSGTRPKAWTTTITYDPADINADEPEAVRRHLPREHDRNVPGRSERSGRDHGAQRRRCWTSCGAGRALPASMPPATPIMGILAATGARRRFARQAGAAAPRRRSCSRSATRTATRN